MWPWPGSDREKEILDWSINDANFTVSHAYKDNEGREWGYTARWGTGWICLADPENSRIPVFNPAPTPLRWSPDGDDWSSAAGNVTIWPPANPASLLNALFVIIAVIIAIAVVTVILILLFRKAKKSKTGDNDDE
jgi:hypothetical protein